MATTPRVSSILLSVKDLLGVPAEAIEFDGQLVSYINMVFETMHQLGFGTEDTYVTTKTSGDITEFLPDDEGAQGMALIYIYTKVRLLFDPPASSFVLTSLQAMIAEYEWRLTNYVPTVI